MYCVYLHLYTHENDPISAYIAGWTLWQIVQIYVYMYVGMCTFIDIHFHVNMCLRVYFYTYKYIPPHVSITTYFCLCVYASTFISLYIYISIYMYTSVHLYKHINISASIYLYIYTSVHMYTSMYLYKHINVSTSISLYVYTSIYIHTSMYLYKHINISRHADESAATRTADWTRWQTPNLYLVRCVWQSWLHPLPNTYIHVFINLYVNVYKCICKYMNVLTLTKFTPFQVCDTANCTHSKTPTYMYLSIYMWI